MTTADDRLPPVLTLSGRRLPVVGRARVYVCGITPYDTTHLGHAATFVWADLAARVLRMAGVEVAVCRNLTDLDDDLLAQARQRGTAWRSLATQQVYRFERDMADLRLAKPTFEPLAHEFVSEVVTITAALLANGRAYEVDGTVFFDGAGVAESAGLDLEGALAVGADHGGASRAGARGPLDAVLWHPSGEGEPAWPSPWGPGRPGWHVECAAMALATLGTGIDLLAGGSDLAFPHHAFQAAMAEAVTGVAPFARARLSVGAVLSGGAKMAKSTANLVLVHDLLERWPADALRLLFLDRPWSTPWEFRESDLIAAADRVDQLWRRAGRPGDDEAASAEVERALFDNLDVPLALAVAEEAGGRVLRRLADTLALL
ncbi:MAG: class I tRNA ligase family protein [Acidimicrobiales bacterium]